MTSQDNNKESHTASNDCTDKLLGNNAAVLIPCYNEQSTIGRVVCDFLEALPLAQIYVYDNNSSDDSIMQVRKIQQQHVRGSQIHLRFERRQGKGNVVRSMLRDIEARTYIIVDGDCTYDASDAPEMLRLVEESGFDMVIGDRLSSTYFSENKRPFHNFGNRLVRKLVNKLFTGRTRGEKITDIMTGYRAMSRAFVKTFPVLSRGFEIETEMTVHALEHNFLITSIPVNYSDRPDGSSSKLHTFRDGSRIVALIFKLLSQVRPMLFFGFSALSCFVLSCSFLIPVLFEFLSYGFVYKVPTFIASGIFLTLSVFSLFTGITLTIIKQHHRRMFELISTQINMLPQINRSSSEADTQPMAPDMPAPGTDAPAAAPNRPLKGHDETTDSSGKVIKHDPGCI